MPNPVFIHPARGLRFGKAELDHDGAFGLDRGLLPPRLPDIGLGFFEEPQGGQRVRELPGAGALERPKARMGLGLLDLREELGPATAGSGFLATAEPAQQGGMVDPGSGRRCSPAGTHSEELED